MATLFISDLHLEDSRPQTTKLLLDFVSGEACRGADALYILGDLFEFWIGDDVVTETASRVAAALKRLADSGVPCRFMHGNRDFLLGEAFALEAGFELLGDTAVVDLYGTPVVLLHGDTLCTDDKPYQAFRQQVRNSAWQKEFLAKSLAERVEMARSARDASMQHTREASEAIMDVNDNAVRNAFKEHGVLHMIHGHTHRPAVHQYSLSGSAKAQRIVLADWHETGSVLRINSEGHSFIPIGC